VLEALSSNLILPKKKKEEEKEGREGGRMERGMEEAGKEGRKEGRKKEKERKKENTCFLSLLLFRNTFTKSHIFPHSDP
jgi:hypothetical protein